MPSEGWFRKRSKFSSAADGRTPNQVPDGVATKCLSCGQILFTKDFEKNLKVCPQCGFHHKLTADERIAYTVDEGSFIGIADNLSTVDTLDFPDYQAKIDKGRKATGLDDALKVGAARIERVPCVFGAVDFKFMGGSMGSVFGEKFVRAVEYAIEHGLPMVVVTASGGARMHEGLLSLMQMAKTSAAVAQLAHYRLPFIVVLTDPTTGGVLASFASLGDIILAEPGANIGFAGARVAAQASQQKPPPDYQTSEWQLGRGQVDSVVHRRDLPSELGALLQLLGHLPVSESESAVDELAGQPREVTVG